MLTVLGAVMVGLGTLASTSIALAAGGAVAIGFLAESPVLAYSRAAALPTALLLAFMLAAAVPATTGSVFPRLAGWLLAGFAAQPILLLVWLPLRAVNSAKNGRSPARHTGWIGHAGGSGVAMGLAVLLTRALQVDHAFWVVLGMIPLLHPTGSRAVRTFWQGQAGTMIGFMAGAALAAIIGSHRTWYWIALPLAVFVAAYVANAVGFMAGQAAFTVFAIVLFCILLPQQKYVGIVRVENIALGGAVSLIVGSLRRIVGAGLEAAGDLIGPQRRPPRCTARGDSL
jgi:hypothetical protein